MMAIPEDIIEKLRVCCENWEKKSITHQLIGTCLPRDLAKICFDHVKGGSPVTPRVKIERCDFKNRFSRVPTDFPDVKERMDEFLEKSYAWLFRVREDRKDAPPFPRIVYYEARLKSKEDDYQTANWKDLARMYEEESKSGGKITTELQARKEYWNHWFQYCKFVVFLHEIAHICFHWCDHFEKEPDHFRIADEWYSVVSMKLKFKEFVQNEKLEQDAWDGAQDLLEMLVKFQVVQEFLKYPTLPRIVAEKILTLLREEDIRAIKRNLKQRIAEFSERIAKRFAKWRAVDNGQNAE